MHRTLFVAALLLAGCARDIQNKEAVRQGVIEYLGQRQSQTGLDMSLMNVEVTSVSFQKDEALATVAFRPKNSAGAGEAMRMNYALKRNGSKWVVKGRRDAGPTPHGGMPAGHPSAEPAK